MKEFLNELHANLNLNTTASPQEIQEKEKKSRKQAKIFLHNIPKVIRIKEM